MHLGTAPSWSELIFALSVAMVAYTGIETVSNMAEEAKDPGARRPSAVNLVLIAVLGVYAGISVVALSALPVHQDAHGHFSTLLGTTVRERPGAGIVYSARPGARAARGRCAYYVGVLAATILLIATNAGLIGISRLSWSLAEHRQLPQRVLAAAPALPHALVHARLLLGPRRLLLIPGQTDFLGNLYSFGAMLSFTIAHVAVIALRYASPTVERPYRVPWNVRFRGGRDSAHRGARRPRDLRGLALGASRCTSEARTVGIAWMVAGLVGYFLYRRRSGLDLTRPRRSIAATARRTSPRSIPLGAGPIFGGDVSAAGSSARSSSAPMPASTPCISSPCRSSSRSTGRSTPRRSTAAMCSRRPSSSGGAAACTFARACCERATRAAPSSTKRHSAWRFEIIF